MDPCDYKSLPSAPPVDYCIACTHPVNNPFIRFPCGCYFHIHPECIMRWRSQNHTCPSCSQIVINVLPPGQQYYPTPPQIQRIHTQTQTQIQRIPTQTHIQPTYDYTCCGIVCLAFFVFLGVCVIVFYISLPFRL